MAEGGKHYQQQEQEVDRCKRSGGKPVNEYYKRKSPTEGGGNEEPPSLEIKGNDGYTKKCRKLLAHKV